MPKGGVHGWLVCVGAKEPNVNRKVEIKEGLTEFSIGRREACNLRYEDATISSMHCKLLIKSQPGGVQVWVEDCSSNGTFVNAQRIGKGKSMPLSHRDQIGFLWPASEGDERPPYAFVWLSGKEAPPPEPEDEPPPRASPRSGSSRTPITKEQLTSSYTMDAEDSMVNGKSGRNEPPPPERPTRGGGATTVTASLPVRPSNAVVVSGPGQEPGATLKGVAALRSLDYAELAATTQRAVREAVEASERISDKKRADDIAKAVADVKKEAEMVRQKAVDETAKSVATHWSELHATDTDQIKRDAEEAKKKAVEEAIAKVQKEATTEIVKRLAEQREKLQAEKEEAIALELHNQEKSVSVKARAELEFVQAQVDAKVDEAVTKERENAAADVAAIMKAKGSEGAQVLAKETQALRIQHAAELKTALEHERKSALQARNRSVEVAVAEAREEEIFRSESKLKIQAQVAEQGLKSALLAREQEVTVMLAEQRDQQAEEYKIKLAGEIDDEKRRGKAQAEAMVIAARADADLKAENALAAEVARLEEKHETAMEKAMAEQEEIRIKDVKEEKAKGRFLVQEAMEMRESEGEGNQKMAIEAAIASAAERWQKQAAASQESAVRESVARAVKQEKLRLQEEFNSRLEKECAAAAAAAAEKVRREAAAQKQTAMSVVVEESTRRAAERTNEVLDEAKRAWEMSHQLALAEAVDEAAATERQRASESLATALGEQRTELKKDFDGRLEGMRRQLEKEADDKAQETIKTALASASTEKVSAVMQAVEAGQTTSRKEFEDELKASREAAIRQTEELAARRLELALRDSKDQAEREKDAALRKAVEEARKQEGRTQEAAAKASEEALARMQRDGEIAVEDMKQQKEKELEMEKAKLKQVAAELASVTEQAAALKKQLAI